MDRLTWQPPNYHGYFTPKDGVDGMDCVQKLAAYEDTGLSPAEVAELAQAEPVKHGKWKPIFKGADTCECSVCKSEGFSDSDFGFIATPYCPNCGAKMDKESDNNV